MALANPSGMSVVVAGAQTEMGPHRPRAPPGCPLSTTAFSWAIEALLRQLVTDVGPGAEVCASADDVAIIVRDPAPLPRGGHMSAFGALRSLC